MRRGLLGSVSVLLTGAGLALAQTPGTPPRLLPIPPAAGAAPLVAPAQPAGPTRPPAATGDAQPSPLPAQAPAPAAGAASCCATTEDFVREAPMPAPGRFYADAEYLFWFTRPTKLPPLVLAGSAAEPSATPAVGQPGTTVVVGDKGVDAGARSGLRLRAGVWLNEAESVGLEGSGFFLTQLGSRFPVASNNTAALGLSFQEANPLTGNPETSLLFAVPEGTIGAAAGAAVVQTSTKFWGADLNVLCNAAGASWYRADALIGVRYLRLQEEVSVTATRTALPEGFVVFHGDSFFSPASTTVRDAFRTANDFYGGQVGAHVLFQKDVWFAEFRALLAAGVTHQAVTIAGSTSLTTADSTVTVPGGLLAQASNIGRHTNNEFTLVPEGGVSVGCQLTSFLRAYAGYSAVYLRQGVLRPGTEIDRLVSVSAIPVQNPAPLGTELRPAPQLHRADFWGQGVHFGIEIDF